MTLVDAPVIPAPVRLAQTSTVGKTCVLLCAYTGETVKPASANNAPQSVSLVPMSQQSFVWTKRYGLSPSGETNSDAKDK